MIQCTMCDRVWPELKPLTLAAEQQLVRVMQTQFEASSRVGVYYCNDKCHKLHSKLLSTQPEEWDQYQKELLRRHRTTCKPPATPMKLQPKENKVDE